MAVVDHLQQITVWSIETCIRSRYGSSHVKRDMSLEVGNVGHAGYKVVADVTG